MGRTEKLWAGPPTHLGRVLRCKQEDSVLTGLQAARGGSEVVCVGRTQSPGCGVLGLPDGAPQTGASTSTK